MADTHKIESRQRVNPLLDRVADRVSAIEGGSKSRLVLVADSHGYTPNLPEGDILIHAGDLTMGGTVRECQDGLDWLNSQTSKHIVMIAGNHDFAFETDAKKARLNMGRVAYLENSETVIDGLRIYGSPVTPWFLDWAFNVRRGEAIRKYWDKIPQGLDILVTHGPPAGILDQPSADDDHLGCEELANAIDRAKPRVHVFGHIHGGRGNRKTDSTEFFNASLVNEQYKLVNEAFRLEI